MHNNPRNFLPKKTSKSFYATIHIAGDYAQAKNLCRQWVMRGACVQVSRVPTCILWVLRMV